MKLYKTHTASNSISCISKDLILGTTAGCIEIIDSIKFKSHSPSFDYLESADISEKINCISRLDLGNSYTNLLTSNEKQIKLFTIRNETEEPSLILDMKESHQYNINDIAQLPHTHNFLSIDYLQLKMNNIELPSYTMINIKPESINELKWLLTSLCIKDTSTFLYGTSNGNTYLNDIRFSPHSQTVNKTNENVEDIYKLICDIKIDNDYFYVRNMKGVSVYDFRTFDLVKSYELISDKTKRMLYYKNDCYDRLQISVDKGRIVTGSFENKCYVIDNEVDEIVIEGGEMVQHCMWHQDSVVVAKNDELYFYK